MEEKWKPGSPSKAMRSRGKFKVRADRTESKESGSLVNFRL